MKNILFWLIATPLVLSLNAQSPKNDLAVLHGDEDPAFICMLEDALIADYNFIHGFSDEEPTHCQKLPPAVADRRQQRQKFAAKQYLGARVTAFQLELNDVEILEADVNRLTVQALEHTSLTYGTGDDQIIGRLTNTRRFLLERADDLWQLVSIELVDESQAGGLLPYSIEGLTMPSPEFGLPDDASQQQEPMPKIAIAYNREAAMNYALNHAENPHSNYRDFSPNDCTNFVSQCLLEGGWQETFGWYRSPNAWWYNRITQSWVWINAQLFSDFLARSGRGQRTSSRFGLAVGDILAIDRDGKNGIDHTMIVTRVTNRDIYLSGRSNNRINLAFGTIQNLHPNAGYIFWRIVATE